MNSRREGFNIIKDIIGPVQQYHKYFKSLLIKGHISNKQRFELFLFLSGNGMPPDLARDVMVMIYSNLDNEARNQLNWLVENCKKLDKYKYWDFQSKKWEKYECY